MPKHTIAWSEGDANGGVVGFECDGTYATEVWPDRPARCPYCDAIVRLEWIVRLVDGQDADPPAHPARMAQPDEEIAL